MADNKGQANKGGAQSGAATAATPAATGEKKTRVRKSAEAAQADAVTKARETLRNTTAQLQAAYMKKTGSVEGNPELVAAYKAFDAVLAKSVAAPAAPAGQTA
jgi:hypothetical protein